MHEGRRPIRISRSSPRSADGACPSTRRPSAPPPPAAPSSPPQCASSARTPCSTASTSTGNIRGGGDNVRKLLGPAEREAEADALRLTVKGLREALDRLGRRTGRRYQLTAAVAGYPRSVAGIDWPGTQAYLNYVFVMTYDFTPEKSFARRGDFSGGGGLPGHHTNLHATPATEGYGADAMIRNLRAAGVPPAKMVIGAAFYGREWKEVDWTGGTFPASAPRGSFAGTIAFKDLKRRDLAAEKLTPGYDETAQAAYRSGPGSFISLDDPRSICAKGSWAIRHGLAGIFTWELNQDDGTLAEAMHRSVHGGC